MMSKTIISAVILAGGNSERMGFPKAYLHVYGKTFLEKIIDKYHAVGIREIVVVMNSDFCNDRWKQNLIKVSSKIKLVKNKNPKLGRFYSLKLGLKNVIDSDFCFIQNIDNPFVNKNVIEKLWKNKNSDGYVSPTFKGKGGHPILISKTIIQQLNEMKDEDLNLKEVLKKFSKTEVEVDDETVLININTPEEYRTFVQDKIDV